jgi:hypothetical protein
MATNATSAKNAEVRLKFDLFGMKDMYFSLA